MRVAVLEKEGKRDWYCLEGALARRFLGSPIDGCALHESEVVPWSFDELRAPGRPSKIVCIGRNYAAHARELGHAVPDAPLMFFKPPSAIIGPGESVVLRAESERVDFEAELGVVIGKRASCVPRHEALSHVFGYTCVNDITARDLQKTDGQWARAKGFDTFCPIGPWIETELDPSNVRVQCIVDGVIRQDARTAQLIFDIPYLVSYVSRAFTLEPGDIIATGTPEGVGPLQAGERVTVAIEHLGELTVSVAAPNSPALRPV